MEKFIKNFIISIKNLVDFLKIITVFSSLMFILLWIQDLLGQTWQWLKFINPILNIFLNLGELISSDSIEILGKTFEYKYFLALMILIILNTLLTKIKNFFNIIQDFLLSLLAKYKKTELKLYNKTLEKQQISEQKVLNKYQVYVEAKIKDKYSNRDYNINLDEQIKIMLKYLVEKTGCPSKEYENGFLFSFDSFENIDITLDKFVKLYKSKAPLDFIICIQLSYGNSIDDLKKINKLKNLKIYNKAIATSDTVYRYGFNKIKEYKISLIGEYQNENTSFEVFEFIQSDKI